MKLIVAGSRSLGKNPVNDILQLELALDSFHEKTPISEVVSGGAQGADLAGECWANRRQLPVKRFPAKWDEYGRAAGILRNCEMAKYADQAIVFWDGKSKGAKHMIEEMKRVGKPVTVVPIHVQPL